MNGRSGLVLSKGVAVTWKVCEAVVWSTASVAVTVMLAVALGGAKVVSMWITPSGLVGDSVSDAMVTGFLGVVPSVPFSTWVNCCKMSWPATIWPKIVWW